MTFPRFGFVRLKQIASPRGPTGLSPSTVWARVKLGTFPVPIKLSSKVTVWRAEQILSFIEYPNEPARWTNPPSEGSSTVQGSDAEASNDGHRPKTKSRRPSTSGSNAKERSGVSLVPTVGT
jgi:predicted DNA-binding transcriptional regulator AlpA